MQACFLIVKSKGEQIIQNLDVILHSQIFKKTSNFKKEMDHIEQLIYLDGTKLDIDPDADVADLFQDFNKRFFWGKLKFVEVRWSPRMTLCAGLCVYKRRPGYCSIRLSRPLLSLRGKVDLVETLIHEMIHAYLFVTENNIDRDGHGPEFLKHMDRINKQVGLNISVYHTFSNEVQHYQQHIWLCNGPCQTRPPYFGKVCRAMNRAPGPADFWYSDHLESCGGTFSKISEPEGYKPPQKKKVQTKKQKSGKKCLDIRNFFNKASECDASTSRKQLSITGMEHQERNCKDDSKNVINLSLNSHDSGINTQEKTLNNNTSEVVSSSSEESDSESEDWASDTSSNDESVLGILGSVFTVPFRISKRKSEEHSDAQSVKIRKPDFHAIPNSKRGRIKNLITVPDQRTLDTFYQKKKSSAISKTPAAAKVSISRENIGKRKTLNQQSLKSYFKKE
ncbi:SprT-like domain-containing protein Spartan [Frankliniella fusca]|uniref:SprT-like domain-containing protein Spartan n=1 Tax=Frankliniella fusca TaxID=407009 RepID=A0AAE1I3P9_9NEOP|nr:SprT-like domain-containing protein Spartan [Frankliniella fusca]